MPDGTALLDRARARTIENIARNADLAESLAPVIEAVEARWPAAACSLMLLRRGRLCHAAGRRVPAAWLDEVDGLAMSGPRPAPFWTPRPAHVEIAAEPGWEEWRPAALELGLRCCSTAPLLSGAGEVLGALTVYFGGAEATDLDFLAEAARLAAVIVDQRNLMDDLVYQAEHDTLTRLPNRRLFEDRLRQALLMCARYGHRAAVLLMDLDRLQWVNDLFGHQVGDILLEKVARRLEACVRRSDTLARSGGDEFLLLLPQVEAPGGAMATARKLLDALADPFEIEGRELCVTASIGVALCPDDAGEPVALLKKCTDAMQRAKDLGRNGAVAFSPEMDRASQQKLEIETHLRRALDNGEICLYYQPQFEVGGGGLAGLEALMRWHSPALGAVSPGAFIPLAEETGLIVPLGAWALEAACAQRAAWGAALGPARVAVNISAVQFARADFVDSIAGVLDRNGLNPALLELELTETVVMGDLERSAARMEQIRRLGISLTLDDFGTGYASLSYLQKLPFDTVKVDRSFISEIRAASDRPPLAHSIIGLAHVLGKRVVAEGIETGEQLQALAAMNCDVAQGFLLATPVPAARVPEAANIVCTP
ncbi:MAG: putative bifunctional diguanylate cyclase/phosphodiesterase [Bryobacteraceae bacterium]